MTKNYKLTRDELQNSLNKYLDLLQTDELDEILITDNDHNEVEAVFISMAEYERVSERLKRCLRYLHNEDENTIEEILKRLTNVEEKVFDINELVSKIPSNYRVNEVISDKMGKEI